MRPKLSTKLCKRCRRRLPHESFDRWVSPRGTSQGWQSYCQECRASVPVRGLKRCSACDQRLPRADFDTNGQGQRYGYCRTCRVERYRPRGDERIAPPNPSGLCLCGCGGSAPIATETHVKDLHLSGHHVRYIQGHQHRLSPVAFIVNPDTGCWEWQLALSNGYGRIRNRQAHRVYYEHAKGPIPSGLDLDHLCRNRCCVNPDHLEPVTRQENLLRGHAARRREHAE